MILHVFVVSDKNTLCVFLDKHVYNVASLNLIFLEFSKPV